MLLEHPAVADAAVHPRRRPGVGGGGGRDGRAPRRRQRRRRRSCAPTARRGWPASRCPRRSRSRRSCRGRRRASCSGASFNRRRVLRAAASTQSESPNQLTIEQLAAQSGMSVRNIRAHQARGLLDPPEVRARVGYYGPEHLAQLRLVRELQDDGFNLGGIKRLLDDTQGTAERLRRFGEALSAAATAERGRDADARGARPAVSGQRRRRRPRCWPRPSGSACSCRSATGASGRRARRCWRSPRRWSGAGSRCAARWRSSRRSTATANRCRARSSSCSCTRSGSRSRRRTCRPSAGRRSSTRSSGSGRWRPRR